jgi:hypothetical protein
MIARLIVLAVAAVVVAGAILGKQSTQTAIGEPPPSKTADVVPAGDPSLCAGSDALACADAIEESLARGTASKQNEVLSTPLAELSSAHTAAIFAGRSISGPQSPPLPKSARDLIDNRLMRIDSSGRVQVFAEARRSVDEVAAAVREGGGTIEREEHAHGIVQAWVPIEGLAPLSSSDALDSVRLPDYGFVSTGSVNSQADSLLGVANARAAYGVSGSGVRVGVISDGVQGIASSQGSGDLPPVNTSTCNEVAQSPSGAGAGAEGTAMLEIVHDLAPGAELWFGHWGFGFTGTIFDFLDAVNCLALNTDVVVDDVYFLNQGPYNGGSAVSVNAAFALNTATNRIKGYFNAVGNSALEHYQGTYVDSINVFPPISGLHVFGPVPFVTSDQYGVGQDIANNTWLPNGESMCLFLQWNDAWGGSINDYDLELWSLDLFNSGNPNFVVAGSSGNQNGTQNPTEQLCFTNNMASGFFGAVIIEFANEQVRTFDMFLRCTICAPLPDGDFGQPYFNYNTWCSSVPNNSDATAGVVGVAAIDAADPGINDREPYSSCGPTNDGRLKPELTALDGISVTANGGFFTPFYGTSAAAPHVGAIAALILDCTPGLTDEQLRDRLFNHADDLGAPGDDNFYGNGRIDVANALSKGNCLPTPTPTTTNTPTATQTPTTTPTSTPKNLADDTDGDTITNDVDDNDDDDGCTDAQETGLVATMGGLRDPHNFWDFFDVPTGGSLMRDGAVASPDIFGVLSRFNSSGDPGMDPLTTPGAAPTYHTAYDRGGVVGANPWNLGAANGSIAATDIFAVLSQFNHSCQS